MSRQRKDTGTGGQTYSDQAQGSASKGGKAGGQRVALGRGRGRGQGQGPGVGPVGLGQGGGMGSMPGSGQGGGKHQRYIQPTIFMALLDGSTHGYDLTSRISEYGFLQAEASPGMIYKHLRQMEEEGLLSSDWDAAGSGPAKRIYSITDAGREALAAWVDYMDRQAGLLANFVKAYRAKD